MDWSTSGEMGWNEILYFLVYSIFFSYMEVPSSNTSPSTPDPPLPPITQVYSRRQPPSITCPKPIAFSLLNPGISNDLPVALREGKHKCTYPVSSFVSYNHLFFPTYSFIVSLES